MKCLVIDDSKTSRLFAKKCISMGLPNQDLIFFEAANGEEGLACLNKEKVDLIISDVNMPIMNGFTFLRNVKGDPNLKMIPIVFITSLANDERKENLLSLGAHDVIKKPLSPKELAVSLSRFSWNKPKDVKEDSWGS